MLDLSMKQELLFEELSGLYKKGTYISVLTRSEEIFSVSNFSLAASSAYMLGRYDLAEKYWRTILEIEQDNADTYNNLGVLFLNMERFEEAEIAFVQTIIFKKDSFQAYNNLGITLKNLHRLDEAKIAYQRALELNPNDAEVHSNLGNLHRELQYFDEAEAFYRQAIALEPDYVNVYRNLGLLLKESKRLSEAEEAYKYVIKLKPECVQTQSNLSFLLLEQGRYTEAWPLFEMRYSSSLLHSSAHMPILSYPGWRGESLSSKSLLIIHEQGFGDEIMFARYVQVLTKMGASRITFVCKASLKSLFQSLSAYAIIVTSDEEIMDHDYWSFLLSLPLYCKTTLETIPSELPYLSVTKNRLEYWQNKLPKKGMLVGLVWKGSSHHLNDLHRSLSSLSEFKPLWSILNVHFISLQKGSGEDEATISPPDQPLIHLGSEIEDFSDTAAIIAQLDLVICVDTAIAHLTGALGKECWVLLPAVGTDWRWLANRTDSPWYPKVMRLFRQTTPQRWDEIITEVAVALKRKLDKSIF